ncbi:MAG: hypothetical protein QOD32_1374 [Pyrinomonadaceae bacterium]|jgi:hypothetical protein|nr:hypothetical protein [Pyrinomonadaceae bacterium]
MGARAATVLRPLVGAQVAKFPPVSLEVFRAETFGVMTTVI